MAPARMRVAVVMGGPSVEHDVSCRSGKNVLENLAPARFEALPVVVGRDGRWRVAERFHPGGRFDQAASLAASSSPSASLSAPEALARLSALGVDLAFLALHGPFGEDGTVQGLLDACGLPYTGSGVQSSALTIDKIATKAVLRYHGLPVADDCVLGGNFAPVNQGTVDRVIADLGLPLVVKAPCLGSSFGVFVVKNRRELDEALDRDGGGREPILLERYMAGRELTCGVLHGPGSSDLEVLPITEIIPRTAAFFDFQAKYTAGATAEVTPADLDPATTDLVQELTREAFVACGCDGMARVDFMLSRGRPWILEVNSIPGLTDTSLLPQQARARGIGFEALLTRIVERALNRQRERRDAGAALAC